MIIRRTATFASSNDAASALASRTYAPPSLPSRTSKVVAGDAADQVAVPEKSGAADDLLLDELALEVQLLELGAHPVEQLGGRHAPSMAGRLRRRRAARREKVGCVAQVCGRDPLPRLRLVDGAAEPVLEHVPPDAAADREPEEPSTGAAMRSHSSSCSFGA